MPILYSFFGPFLIWPLEYFLPYPYIVEELFKAVVVARGPKGLWFYVLSGIAFAFSETILYALNFGSPLQRFAATSILHSSTFAIIYLFSQKKLIWLGFLIAALTHYLFNSLMA